MPYNENGMRLTTGVSGYKNLGKSRKKHDKGKKRKSKKRKPSSMAMMAKKEFGEHY